MEDKKFSSPFLPPILHSQIIENNDANHFINLIHFQNRFINESERRVDYNQMMSYPSIIANRWLAVRLEMLGAVIVFFAAFFAIIFDIGPSTVGLSISYALQVSSTLNMLCRMTTELETNIVAIERVDEYSDVKQEAPWKTIEVVSLMFEKKIKMRIEKKN